MIEAISPPSCLPQQVIAEPVATDSLSELADRVRGARPPFFMTHTTSLAIANFFSDRIARVVKTWVSIVRPIVEEKVKELVVIIQNVFAAATMLLEESKAICDVSEWLLSRLIQDRQFSEKIAAEQKILLHKTGNSLCSEVGKVLAKYGSDCVRHHVQQARALDQEIRPDWVSPFVKDSQGEMRYSFLGKQASLYLEKNGALIDKVIELNLLRVFSRVIDRLYKVQNESRFALLDLLRDFLSKEATHFRECHVHDTKEALVKLPENGGDLFFKTLSSNLLNIAMPDKGKDLELPFSPFLNSYLSEYIFDKIRDDVLPHGLKIIFELLGSPYVKDFLFINGFQLIHELVDKEYKPYEASKVEIQYPDQAELAKSLEDCILNFLDYVDPSQLPWIFKNFAPKRIAEASSESITLQLQSVTLQELFMQCLEMLAPIINPGGSWVEADGQKQFQMVPFVFETTLAERQKAEAVFGVEVAEQRKQLEDLVAIIGLEAKGLVQAAQDKVFAVSSTTLIEEKPATDWFSFSGIQANITNIYEQASKIMVKSSFHFMGVTEKVQALNKEILEKINRPEHKQIYFDISESLMMVLSRNASVSETKDSPDKLKDK